MKIKFTNKGEVPLDKYPVGTLIVEKCSTWDDEYVYIAYRVSLIDAEKYLEDDENVILKQSQTKTFEEWVALEVEE